MKSHWDRLLPDVRRLIHGIVAHQCWSLVQRELLLQTKWVRSRLDEYAKTRQTYMEFTITQDAIRHFCDEVWWWQSPDESWMCWEPHFCIVRNDDDGTWTTEGVAMLALH